MKLTRRSFVKTVFMASQAGYWNSQLSEKALAQTSQSSLTEGSSIDFFVLGDWGRKGRPDQQQVADQLSKQSTAFPPHFVVSVGDNFYEGGVESIEDEHWQRSFEQVYAAPTLQVPWYVILGNHDYVGNTEAQLAYAKQSTRWKMPARYWAQDTMPVGKKNVDLFFIDTCPAIHAYHDVNNPEHPALVKHVMEQDWVAQLNWLEQALRASKADWKIVFGHHPIYSGGIHGDQPEMIEQVLPLFQQHGVQAYFCGHDHDLQHLQAQGVDLFVSGGGSEHRLNFPTDHSRFSQSASGFMAVSLRAEAMTVQIINSAGSLLYKTSVAQRIVS